MAAAAAPRDAYLRPALARKNLTRRDRLRLVSACSSSIGTRAVGVEYMQARRDGVARTPRAKSSSCGGVINSPQLLMLSGIGDPDELRAHDIAVKVALPGVGKNLQDHISASIAYARKKPGTLAPGDAASTASCRRWPTPIGAAKALPPNCRPAQMAFLKSRPDVALPDVELIFNAAPMTAAAIFLAVPRALRRQLRLPRAWCCGRKAAARSS